MKGLRSIGLLCVCLGIAVSGCRGTEGSDGVAPVAGPKGPAEPAAKPAPAPATDADLAKAKVNESGQIMVLEYHNIRKGKTPYDRTPEAFRKDLDTLYAEGYRPISLHDYLDNRIDVPPGLTPVVLSFDDASATQFHYLADGAVDPNCAFGILKAFHEAHPDFAMRGIFFMNASPTGKPAPVFGDQSTAAKKVKELLAAGMEVGNHTVTHTSLKKLSDAGVQKELADCVAGIHALAPEAVVDTLALPFGISPRNRKLAADGESGGVQYHNRAVLLVGANPAPAPCSPKFNPLRLPRVQAYEGELGSRDWLDKMSKNPKMRYISDGDPTTVTVPKAAEAKIDPAKLGTAKLRTY